MSGMRFDTRTSRAFSRRCFDCAAFQRAFARVCLFVRLCVYFAGFNRRSRARAFVENFSAVGNVWISGFGGGVFRIEKFAVLSFYAFSSIMKIVRKFLLCLICLSVLSSCKQQEPTAAFNNTFSKLSKKERISALNDSVFCISVVVAGKDYEKRFSVGTGFLIGDGLIASAAHVQTKVVELPGKFKGHSSKVIAWKKFNTGEIVEFPIQIAITDEQSDLAVYRFDHKLFLENPKLATARPLTLAENLPPIGEEVISIGYYGAYEFPFNSIGNVSMIDTNEDIFSDLTLMPGNSGAPVCDLETGEVLGVTTDVLDLGNETVRYGIAKRALKLRQLLQKL